MVHDAVAGRGGEFVVREDRAPFTGLDVRGEDDAPSFVAARDDPVRAGAPRRCRRVRSRTRPV